MDERIRGIWDLSVFSLERYSMSSKANFSFTSVMLPLLSINLASDAFSSSVRLMKVLSNLWPIWVRQYLTLNCSYVLETVMKTGQEAVTLVIPFAFGRFPSLLFSVVFFTSKEYLLHLKYILSFEELLWVNWVNFSSCK